MKTTLSALSPERNDQPSQARRPANSGLPAARPSRREDSSPEKPETSWPPAYPDASGSGVSRARKTGISEPGNTPRNEARVAVGADPLPSADSTPHPGHSGSGVLPAEARTSQTIDPQVKAADHSSAQGKSTGVRKGGIRRNPGLVMIVAGVVILLTSVFTYFSGERDEGVPVRPMILTSTPATGTSTGGGRATLPPGSVEGDSNAPAGNPHVPRKMWIGFAGMAAGGLLIFLGAAIHLGRQGVRRLQEQKGGGIL